MACSGTALLFYFYFHNKKTVPGFYGRGTHEFSFPSPCFYKCRAIVADSSLVPDTYLRSELSADKIDHQPLGKHADAGSKEVVCELRHT
jgi:hypothetical protein